MARDLSRRVSRQRHEYGSRAERPRDRPRQHGGGARGRVARGSVRPGPPRFRACEGHLHVHAAGGAREHHDQRDGRGHEPRLGRLRGSFALRRALDDVVAGRRDRRPRRRARAAPVELVVFNEVEEAADRGSDRSSARSRARDGLRVRRPEPLQRGRLSAGVFLSPSARLDGIPIQPARGGHGHHPDRGDRDLGHAFRSRPVRAPRAERVAPAPPAVSRRHHDHDDGARGRRRRAPPRPGVARGARVRRRQRARRNSHPEAGRQPRDAAHLVRQRGLHADHGPGVRRRARRDPLRASGRRGRPRGRHGAAPRSVRGRAVSPRRDEDAPRGRRGVRVRAAAHGRARKARRGRRTGSPSCAT